MKTNHGRESSPKEHPHSELRQPIAAGNHHSKSGLVVQSNKAAQRISPKVSISKFKNINNILHQYKFWLQIRDNVHERNHLLVFLIFQWLVIIPEPVEPTDTLTWWATAYDINSTL